MKKLKVLHFFNNGVGDVNVRLQRSIQSDLDSGFELALFTNSEADVSNMWIPDADQVSTEFFDKSVRLTYLFPVKRDYLGLKKVFERQQCEFVHAHNLDCANYAYNLGLPTIFNDWEYHLEYFDYETDFSRNCFSKPLRFYRRKRAKKILRRIIRQVPTIVTNFAVAEKYRELGAENVAVVPNVPLHFEVDYATADETKKENETTTVYIGNMAVDDHTVLRNTSGIKELWTKCRLGKLVNFGGRNYLPHLTLMRQMRRCHFNLLFWKPLNVHKYYVQNKAFLASVVGVPTIVSSSLESTIELLGDYALVVHNLEEIPSVINSPEWADEHGLNPAHIWEYHVPEIKKIYGEMN